MVQPSLTISLGWGGVAPDDLTQLAARVLGTAAAADIVAVARAAMWKLLRQPTPASTAELPSAVAAVAGATLEEAAEYLSTVWSREEVDALGTQLD